MTEQLNHHHHPPFSNNLFGTINNRNSIGIEIPNKKNGVVMLRGLVDSDEFKELFNLLSNNPLLRFRLYTIRKKFSSGKTIAESLMKHEQKIKWQLQRIYRARNMATHLGIEMPYSKQVINNLHNYFDYIVNFIICKIECNEFISDLASIIFQAKIDNQIHKEILKEENDLTPENYKKVFFGPDNRLISYEFEFEETYRDTAKRN